MAHSENFEFKQNVLSEAGRKNWDDIFGEKESLDEKEVQEEKEARGSKCSSE